MKTFEPSCAIAYSANLFGDKWSLLILRDFILHKKTRFKELISSKEKISTNILTNRLKSLLNEDLIRILDPKGTKKSRQYFVTEKGLLALPIIIEFYLFSVHYIEESKLNESQMMIKKELLQDRILFEEQRIKSYLHFVNKLHSKQAA
ncbi:MAG: helix-turn-helix transcriptional regulator [Polaribacter sp.]|jgi:DNA-binding HxlR family transcriptional regulator|nr:helix-turn-helix transcriptional regulator [Polaribacter sp.]